MVKTTKQIFFDKKIDQISNKKCGPWELINWVKRHKFPAIEAIQYNNCFCIELDNLWNALHNSFNSAQNQQVDINLLKEIPDKKISEWLPFLIAELFSAIKKFNNLLAPRPNKLE